MLSVADALHVEFIIISSFLRPEAPILYNRHCSPQTQGSYDVLCRKKGRKELAVELGGMTEHET